MERIIAPELALIPLFPLLGALAALLAQQLRRPAWSGIAATGAAAASFFTVLAVLPGLGGAGVLEYTAFEWLSVGNFTADLVLRFDRLTAVMCLVVTGVGSLIHLYSIAYMAEDPSRPRFFAYLNLFMFSMLLLVLGGNLLVLFAGWEGVGLCSYLLIGFWFGNPAYAAAGRKAFIVNRIGDAGFLLGIFLIYAQFGTVDMAMLQGAVQSYSGPVLIFSFITICLFTGAAGKSAQIPLFVWLPDAMAGPTPVSALIHAATMVTAGIYMMARLHFLFSAAPFTGAVVAVIAVLTAFIAATIALVQNDIKKVLAYSTVSQLGFMFMAAAVGAYWVAVFHLVTHAFFKACLFLSAGSVIQACHHEQDMRHMGGLRKHLPITFWAYLLSTVAIAGIFPFAGYYSKHGILEVLAEHHNAYLSPAAGRSLFLLASFTAILTAFYMTRSVMLTFFGGYRGHAHPKEGHWTMWTPLVILAAFAVVAGFGLTAFLPLDHYLAPVLPHTEIAVSHDVFHGLLYSWGGLLGIGAAVALYGWFKELPGRIYQAVLPLSQLLSGKYYLDEAYDLFLIRPLYRLANGLWKSVDQWIIDGMVNGVASLTMLNGEVLRRVQAGQVRLYALFIFMATLVLLGLYLA